MRLADSSRRDYSTYPDTAANFTVHAPDPHMIGMGLGASPVCYTFYLRIAFTRPGVARESGRSGNRVELGLNGPGVCHFRGIYIALEG